MEKTKQSNNAGLLPQKTRLYSIDALKLCCVGIVFAFHCNIHLGVHFLQLTSFISQGAVVMDFFFLLSGFALYYSYQGVPLSSGKELRSFYRKRFISIYPLYLAVVIIYLLFLGAGTVQQKLLALPIELLLLQSWFPGLFSYSHNGRTWFLSCLMFGYLLFPVLKRLLEKLRTRFLLFLCGILYALCAIAPFIVTSFGLPNIYSNPLLRLLQFLQGMILAALMLRFAEKRPPLVAGAGIAAASAIALVVVVGQLAVRGYYPGQYVTYGFVTLPLFMLITAGCVWAELGAGPRKNISMALKKLSAFGYPIFLAQFFVWAPVQRFAAAHPHAFEHHKNWKLFLLSVLLCAVGAVILRFFVDAPCRRWFEGKPLWKRIPRRDRSEGIVLSASPLEEPERSRAKLQSLVLFVATAVLFLCWLIPQGSMAQISGDAAEIWKTIKTFYTDDIYPTYVLYKGFLSVYPYVWLYQLSILFGTNEFLFVMIYHAILFAYIVAIGIPHIITHFFRRNPAIWQRILLIVFLFYIWRDTYALNQLMVDLPSCAMLFLAMHTATTAAKRAGKKRAVLVAVTGLLCGMMATISGQYSIAAGCVAMYMIIRLRPWRVIWEHKKQLVSVLCLFLLLIGIALPYGARILFENDVVEPMRAEGAWIPEGSFWLQRSLINSTGNRLRAAYGPTLTIPRGYAILTDYYGSEEIALEKLSAAQAGAFGWTVSEWFSVFAKYPFDFLVIMLDKLFVMLSINRMNNDLYSLMLGYILLFIAMFGVIRQVKKMEMVLRADFFLAIAPIASIVSNLIMGVEMRYAMSLHALVFGVALLGPTIPGIWNWVKSVLSTCKEHGIGGLRDLEFPWPVVVCILFVLLCNAHIGALYAQSGAAMLFSW